MKLLVFYKSGRSALYQQVDDYEWSVEHNTLFIWSRLFPSHEKRIVGLERIDYIYPH